MDRFSKSEFEALNALIIKDEDGYERTLENVLGYDALTTEDVDCIVNDNNLTPLTEEQLEKVERAMGRLDRFPDMTELKWVIKDVLEERA